MEEMRQKAGAKEYSGHSYMELARFDENTRHMVIFDVMTYSSPVGVKGERMRLFLSEEGYKKALDNEDKGHIRIFDYLDQSSSAVLELEKYKSVMRDFSDRAINRNGEITKEYIAYAIDMECAVRTLQKKLELCETPKQIALIVMRTIVDFYDAERCGAVDVDLDLGVWTTFWWYSQELGEMPARKCKEIEIMDNFEHWYTSIRSREPLILSDTSVFQESNPEEYELYDRLDIRSIMAVPFWMHSTGVLALKNPKKHNNQIGLLRLLSYPVISSINEYRLQETNRLSVVSSAFPVSLMFSFACLVN